MLWNQSRFVSLYLFLTNTVKTIEKVQCWWFKKYFVRGNSRKRFLFLQYISINRVCLVGQMRFCCFWRPFSYSYKPVDSNTPECKNKNYIIQFFLRTIILSGIEMNIYMPLYIATCGIESASLSATLMSSPNFENFC